MVNYTLTIDEGSELCDFSIFDVKNFDVDDNTVVFDTEAMLSIDFFESVSKKFGMDFDVIYQDRKNHTEGIIVMKNGCGVYINEVPDIRNPAYIKDMLKIETYYALLERLNEDAHNKITQEEIFKLAEKDDWEALFSAVYSYSEE